MNKNIDDIEEKEKKKKKRLIIIIIIILLLLLLLWWYFANKKPVDILGEKEENNNTVVENTVNEDNTTNSSEQNTTVIIQGTDNKKNDEKQSSQEPEKMPVEINKEFVVTSRNERWTENLEIFNNEKYDGKAIIYPGVSNTYYFEITNTLDFDVECNIKFTETNKEKLPINYKLKQNNEYVRGDSKNYVDYSRLNIEKFIVKSNSKNIYALDWKWLDTLESENIYGELGKTVNYQLQITVEAEQI